MNAAHNYTASSPKAGHGRLECSLAGSHSFGDLVPQNLGSTSKDVVAVAGKIKRLSLTKSSSRVWLAINDQRVQDFCDS